MEVYHEELKIIDLFRKNLFSEYSINEIMRKLGKKSYNWTHGAVMRLSKDFLTIEKSGSSVKVRINLKSQTAIAYLAHLDKIEACEKKLPLMNEIIESVSKKTPFFTLILAGSHAKGAAKSNSDMDIVTIVQDEKLKKDVAAYVKEATRLSEYEVDAHIVSKNDFIAMLANDEENFGKEVFRKHIIFYGAEAYYQMVKEAAKNGLQAKV